MQPLRELRTLHTVINNKCDCTRCLNQYYFGGNDCRNRDNDNLHPSNLHGNRLTYIKKSTSGETVKMYRSKCLVVSGEKEAKSKF